MGFDSPGSNSALDAFGSNDRGRDGLAQAREGIGWGGAPVLWVGGQERQLSSKRGGGGQRWHGGGADWRPSLSAAELDR